MKIKQRASWWVDMILFIGFLVAFFLSFTGVELHQWIGVIGGILAAYHLLAHWDWVNAVSKRIFAQASGTVQLKFVTDGIILAGFVTIISTGLVISIWLDLSLTTYTSWLFVHIQASITTLLALLVKLALHWRWISRSARATFSPSATPSGRSLQPVAIRSQSMDRRDFLKLMGLVGGVSLVALLNATNSLASLGNTATSAASQSEAENSTTTSYRFPSIPQSSSTNLSTSGTCSIRCGERCSYPGQCRRYADTNNNDRCDFGECA